MSKWQNFKSTDIRKVIRKLDLQESGKEGAKRSKHDSLWYYLDGKKALRITMPNTHGGSGSMSTGFLQQIKKSLRVSNNEFEDLVDCPLSAEEYEGIVRDKLP